MEDLSGGIPGVLWMGGGAGPLAKNWHLWGSSFVSEKHVSTRGPLSDRPARARMGIGTNQGCLDDAGRDLEGLVEAADLAAAADPGANADPGADADLGAAAEPGAVVGPSSDVDPGAAADLGAGADPGAEELEAVGSGAKELEAAEPGAEDLKAHWISKLGTCRRTQAPLLSLPQPRQPPNTL